MIEPDFAKSPTVFYNHIYTLPIATSLWRKSTDEGVLAKTRFGKTSFAQDILNLHKDGILNTWSIGWRPQLNAQGFPLPESLKYDEDKDILHINLWELMEYSSAPMAMNPNALDTIKTLVKSNEMQQFVRDFENQDKIEKALSSLDGHLKKIDELVKVLDTVKAVEDRMGLIEGDVAELTALIKSKIKNVSKEITGNTEILVDSALIDEIIAKKFQ
jgi:hypothetical protein